MIAIATKQALKLNSKRVINGSEYNETSAYFSAWNSSLNVSNKKLVVTNVSRNKTAVTLAYFLLK
ncbi:hypothetical protein GCM10009084_09660 [Marinomonas primoryensis]